MREIVPKQRDDHTIVAGNEITITQDDASQTLYNKLTDAGADRIVIGSRQSSDSGAPSDIAGVIAKTDVTHAGGITTIKAEVLKTAIAGQDTRRISV